MTIATWMDAEMVVTPQAKFREHSQLIHVTSSSLHEITYRARFDLEAEE